MMNDRDKTKEKIDFTARFRKALDLRNHSDKSLAELKEIFNVSRTLIHQWNNAISIPSIYTASIITEKLNVSYEWLLTGEGRIEGFEMQSPDEVTLIAQFRNLTKAGQLKLMTNAFDECKAHEKTPTNKEDKQIGLRLVKKKR